MTSITLLLVLMFACTTQSPEPNPNISIRQEFLPKGIISLQEAINIAENYSPPKDDSKQDYPKNLREKGTEPKKVKDSKIIKGNDNLPAMYVLNYEKEGYMILSADEKFIPILAFVEKGESFSEEFRKKSQGFDSWIKNTVQVISDTRKGKIKEFEGVKKFWDMYRNNTFLPLKNGRVLCAEGWSSTALYTSTWDQSFPYNSALFRNLGCSDPLGNPPTGCNATAMSIIMRYHNQPNYDWNDFANIANLMRQTGESVGTSYNCANSIADRQNLPGGFNNFGYYSQYWHYVPNDMYPLRVDIVYNNRPVLLTADPTNNGIGHTWVCDGMMEYNFGCPTNIIWSWLSMNWGYGGNNNGWYFGTYWNPGGVEYTNQQWALVNIHP